MTRLAILLVGVGGVGKSTASQDLDSILREFGYEPWVVRFDRFRKRIAPPGADPFSADPRIKQIIYDRAIEIFNHYLDAGGSLIIDAGLSSERIRRRMKDRIPGLRIVHIHCPLWRAVVRDTRRSLKATPHERGWFLHLRAIRDRLNPFLNPEEKFPQPGITYKFEYPACADLHINSAWVKPSAIARKIVDQLGIESAALDLSNYDPPQPRLTDSPPVT
jgi:predicted kinase